MCIRDSLYGALSTLVDNKLIIPKESEDSNPRRKIYVATQLGEMLIKYEIKRLEEMINNGRVILKRKGA